MHYFLNVNLGRHLTGIEHAAIKRLKLFKKMNREAKIVTINYNTELSRNVLQNGLDSSDVINMYDYFQCTPTDYNKSFTLEDLLGLNSNLTYNPVNNSNDFRIYDNGQYVMYVHCFELETKSIGYINYFDQYQRKIKRQIFDIRGFKSLERILGDNQLVLKESFFKVTGEVSIEKYYWVKNGKNELTSIFLNKDNQYNHVFKSEQGLMTFFLEELIEQSGDQIVFFSDKNKLIMPALLEVSQPCKRIPVIHSVHVKNPRLMDGDYNRNYTLILNNFEIFDACVVSTADQKKDIEQRFTPKCPIYDIPGGFVQKVKRKPMSERKQNRIICVARYSAEKRLDHIIRAVHRVKCHMPDIELYLFGFGNASDGYKVEKELKKLIKELSLEDCVYMKGYTTDTENELDNSQLFILTSTVEGFCLSLLEALSHGVPAISYDIKYGPADMIFPGVNGYLVTDSDIEELANKMVDFLSSDTAEKQSFSDNAYKYAELFSEATVIRKWGNLLSEI